MILRLLRGGGHYNLPSTHVQLQRQNPESPASGQMAYMATVTQKLETTTLSVG